LQISSIHFDYALNSVDFRLLEAAIEGETMVNLTFAQEMGHAAETKERELFKMIVGLQDVAYLDDGLFVLVCNAARVMQTLRVVDLAVRCSKVDCDGE
jgi:hypothetical protein